jgi:hypothetical protein
MNQQKRGKGGDVKKAPPGFYMAREARAKLGLNESTFNYYVREGRIKRYIPPLKKEGFYKKTEIDKLATELALFLHTETDEESTTVTRVAQPSDAQGVVKVLTDMGWPSTTPQQRVEWYEVNPYVDFVAVIGEEVKGYIHAVPYKPEVLADIMSGKKRSWHIQPQDILPYSPGTFDLYIGIATAKDVPHHTHRLGFRLISGFLALLEELASQNIIIHRLYAVSAEEDGQRLCKSIGFIQLPTEEGDLFPRFMLDLQTSESHFARLYREVVSKVGESR